MKTLEPVPLFKIMPMNERGRDFCVGGVEGCWTMLQALLAAVNFDSDKDRLFSTGNLSPHGSEALDCIRLAEKPWVHPVRGHLDSIQLRYLIAGEDRGAWEDFWHETFVGEVRNFGGKDRLAKALWGMPMAMEVPMRDGRRIGITHAGLAGHAWADVRELQPAETDSHLLGASPLLNDLLWDTTAGWAIALSGEPNGSELLRRQELDVQLGLMAAAEPILDIDLLISGRVWTQKTVPVRCNNRILLHTGAGNWGGCLAILELESFHCWTVKSPVRHPGQLEPEKAKVLVGDPRRLWISPEELILRSEIANDAEGGP